MTLPDCMMGPNEPCRGFTELDNAAQNTIQTQAEQIARLRAWLEEIAHHYIDSELASREKRGMARKALSSEQLKT